MDIDDVRKKLHDLCQDSGSIFAWAAENEISFSYAAAVIRGDKPPSNTLLKKIGLRKAFQVKKTNIMKFEDIPN